jgi:hypothetical protein
MCAGVLGIGVGIGEQREDNELNGGQRDCVRGMGDKTLKQQTRTLTAIAKVL